MAKHELDLLYVKNPTQQRFAVKWGGIEYALGPGQQTIWQRFLAEHYAKYLANAILLQKESKHKKDYLEKGGHLADYRPVAYLNSKKHRPPVIDQILVGVYTYHQPGVVATPDPNAMAEQAAGAKTPPPLDVGQIDGDGTGGVVTTAFDDEEETDQPLQLMPDQPAAQAQPASIPPLSPPPMTAPAPVDPAPVPMQQPTVPPLVPAVNQPVAPAQPAPLPGGHPPIGPAPVVTPAAPQTPSQDSEQPLEDAEKVKRPQLVAEAKKLGITIPFGSSNEDIKELIKKEYA